MLLDLLFFLILNPKLVPFLASSTAFAQRNKQIFLSLIVASRFVTSGCNQVTAPQGIWL